MKNIFFLFFLDWTEDHLILLDFVGYYLCKLIVRHCLLRVCDGGLKERFSSSMCSSSSHSYVVWLGKKFANIVTLETNDFVNVSTIFWWPKNTKYRRPCETDDVNECHTTTTKNESQQQFLPIYRLRKGNQKKMLGLSQFKSKRSHT
jgi:hypothetical protein